MSDAAITPTLLFVDDEPGILSALRRLFRPYGYRILLAESGAAGLAALAQESVDLIISDMRMPEMDGAAFLKAARTRWPDTLRILLTGYADVTSTVAAINEGEIYRYVAKPWDDDEIVNAVRDALQSRRLGAQTQAQNTAADEFNARLAAGVAERTAELRQTLAVVEQMHGELKKSFLDSVQLFAGLMERRVSPNGGKPDGHGRRVRELACALAARLGLPDSDAQNIMLAALLLDIGKLGLPDDLLDQPFHALAPEQQALLMKLPGIGQNILIGIDKFKEAAIIIRHHRECFDGSGYPDRLAGLAIPSGSRLLAVVNDYDALQSGTLEPRSFEAGEALDYLIDSRAKRYDPAMVDALAMYLAETQPATFSELALPASQLKPGMVLSSDLAHPDGYPLLVRGASLNADIIAQLIKIEEAAGQTLPVCVREEKT